MASSKDYYVQMDEERGKFRRSSSGGGSMATTILLMLIAAASLAGFGVIVATYVNLPGKQQAVDMSSVNSAISSLTQQLQYQRNSIDSLTSQVSQMSTGNVISIDDSLAKSLTRSKYAFRVNGSTNNGIFQGHVCDMVGGEQCTVRFNEPTMSAGLDDFKIFNTINFAEALGYEHGAETTYGMVSDDKYLYLNFETPMLNPNTNPGPGPDGSLTFGGLQLYWYIFPKYSHSLYGQGPSYFVKIEKASGRLVLWKKASDVTGIPTTDYHTYAGTGNDIVRGPFFLYEDDVYFNNYQPIHPTIFKMDKNFNLKWKYELPAEYRLLTNSPNESGDFISDPLDKDHANGRMGLKFGHLSVIPPDGVKTFKPIVIAGASGGAAYYSANPDGIQRVSLDTYRGAEGYVFAVNDDGSPTMAPSLRWKFSTCPNAFKAGDKLSALSFGETQSTLTIHYPIHEGMVFKNRDNSNPGTAGIQRLIIPLDENGHLMSASDPNFVTSVPITVNFPNDHVFSKTKTYNSVDGKYTNIPGSMFSEYYRGPQPLVKSFQLSHVGNYVLDAMDAYHLSHNGAGVYVEMFYDAQEQSIIFGTGNGYKRPQHETEHVWKDLIGINNYYLTDFGYLPIDGRSMLFQKQWDNIAAVSGRTTYKDVNGVEIVGVNKDRSPPTPIQFPNVEKNPTVTLQEIKKSWDLIDTIETRNLNSRANRYFYGSTVSLDVFTGELKFAIPTFGMPDEYDHSWMFGPFFSHNALTGKLPQIYDVPEAFFEAEAYNQDTVGVFVTTLTRDTGNFKKGQRILVSNSKSRFTLFDYDYLCSHKTLTHVDGDTSLDYSKGIKRNTAWEQSLIWADKTAFISGHVSFGGYTFDGEMLIRKTVAAPASSKFAAISYFDHAKANDLSIFNTYTEGNGALTGVGFNNNLISAYNIYNLLSNPDYSQWHPYEWYFKVGASFNAIHRLAIDNNYVHFGSNLDSYYFLDKKTGHVEKVWNIPNGCLNFMVQDNAIFYTPGQTKYKGPDTPTQTFIHTMFMLTPFGK